METKAPIPTNTPQKPTLLLIICYYLIVKSGVKALMSGIFLVGGKALDGLTKQEGFDTIGKGGPALQVFIIVLSAIGMWAAWQILHFRKKGLFTYIGVVVVSFFGPIFFHTNTYTPSMISLTLSAIPVVLLFKYWGDFK